jgi:hypothetical protein
VKLEYLEKESTSHDVYFLGSSHSFRNTNPAVFDSLTGLKSFNISPPGTRPPELYMIVDHLLDKKTNSAAQTYIVELIDLHEAFIKDDKSVRRNYWMTLENYQFGMRNFMEKRAPRTMMRYTEGTMKAQTKFGMGRQQYQSIDKIRDTIYPLGPLQNGHTGFPDQIKLNINLESIIYRRQRFEADTSELWKRRNLVLSEMKAASGIPHKVHLGKIKSMIDRATEKNVKLVFVRAPIQQNVWGLLNDIPQGHKLDLGNPLTHPELYETRYHFDHGHLSAEGAVMYTRLLSEAFLRGFDSP